MVLGAGEKKPVKKLRGQFFSRRAETKRFYVSSTSPYSPKGRKQSVFMEYFYRTEAHFSQQVHLKRQRPGAVFLADIFPYFVPVRWPSQAFQIGTVAVYKEPVYGRHIMFHKI